MLPRFLSHYQSAHVLCVCVCVLSVNVVWMEKDIIGSVDSAVRSSVFSRTVVVVAKRKKKESIGQPVRE